MRKLSVEECRQVSGGGGIFWVAGKIVGSAAGRGGVSMILGTLATGPIGFVAATIIGAGVSGLINLEYEAMNEGREARRVENYEP